MSNRLFVRVAQSDGQIVHAEIKDGAAQVLSAAPWLGGVATGETVPSFEGISDRRLVAPVTPSKILCVGRNYAAHAKELGNDLPVEPMLFLKPPSSLIGVNEAVMLPPASISERIEHEAELVVVIGKTLQQADEATAQAAIFGYSVACDVTARDLQKKDGQWWRAKGMDTFCPVGPQVVTNVDPTNLRIQCWVNDELRQDGLTSNMIFSIPRVLSHVSQVMTLLPGDIVLTGTPEGVGPLKAGDRLRIEIANVGTLAVAISARGAA